MKFLSTITVLLLGWLVVFPSHAEECEGIQPWLDKLAPFAFPADTQFREAHPLPIEPPESIRKQNTSNQTYLAGIDRLQSELNQRFHGRKSPSCVLYPCIGYDVGLPARLFPNARLIIGLDRLPFSTTLDLFVFRYFPVVGQSWVNETHLKQLPALDTELVGNLHASVPNFRPRSIILAQTSRQTPTPRTQAMINAIPSLKRDPHSNDLTLYLGGGFNGVVSFDQGPGTPLRHYVHVQSYIFALPLHIWWLHAIARVQPDATIIKATNWLYLQNKHFRNILFRQLRSTQGLLIEGFQGFHLGTGKISELPESGQRFIPNTEQHVFPDLPFGYENKVRVSVFNGPSK